MRAVAATDETELRLLLFFPPSLSSIPLIATLRAQQQHPCRSPSQPSLILRLRSAHAVPTTVPLYSTITVNAVRSEAYIVSIVTFVRPVRRLDCVMRVSISSMRRERRKGEEGTNSEESNKTVAVDRFEDGWCGCGSLRRKVRGRSGRGRGGERGEDDVNAQVEEEERGVEGGDPEDVR